MDLLLLAGNSSQNKSWIYEVRDTLQPLFRQCMVHEYEHWSTGGDFINLDQELTALRPKVAGLGEYVIFSKSVGSILTLKGIHKQILTPQRCVIAGLPMGLVARGDLPLTTWLQANTVPLLFIQNSNDPAGSAQQVREYLVQFAGKPYQIVELPGKEHHYPDLPKLKELVQAFLV